MQSKNKHTTVFSKKGCCSMKKRWLVFGLILAIIAVAVAAVLLLRKPPLIREDGIESIVVTIRNQHKEITDPKLQKQILKRVNGLHRQEEYQGPTIYGSAMGIYFFYEDGTRDSIGLTVHSEFVDPETGEVTPYFEILYTYKDAEYLIENGTVEHLVQYFDDMDQPYEEGVLPEERMRELGMID